MPDENIVVGVRLRPFVGHEAGQKQCFTVSGNVVSVVPEAFGDGKVFHQGRQDFTFDHAMDSTDPTLPHFVSQEKCYGLMAESMINHVMGGYSVSLFCYGQTGTGKTTTMFGKAEPVSEQGLLLRLLHDLFEVTSHDGSEFNLTLQILEVHNEKVCDLLAHTKEDSYPDIHVHPKLGVYLKGAVEETVNSKQECMKLMDFANSKKKMALTAMNSQSSRSHTIFKLNVEKHGGKDNTIVTSEIFFVDLAGRENERTTKVTGERMIELSFINTSLMHLSHCIQALGAPKKGRRHTVCGGGDGSPHEHTNGNTNGLRDMIAFRNSKLTLLLANALSGNCKTSMVGTLSPAAAHYDETMTTLNFANIVKQIKMETKAAVAVDKDRLVESLQAELQQLREKLKSAVDSGSHPGGDFVSQLEVTGGKLTQYATRWAAKQRWNLATRKILSLIPQQQQQEEVRQRQPMQHPSREQLSKMPHLVSSSLDPSLDGSCSFAPTEIGREYCIGYDPACDFILPRTPCICPKTCYIRLEEGMRLFVRPFSTNLLPIASVELNGSRLLRVHSRSLSHEDTLVLGRSHAFRVKLPQDEGLASADIDRQSSRRTLPMWSDLSNDSRQVMLSDILGASRAADPPEIHFALRHLSRLQDHNRDAKGMAALDEFLVMNRRAASMVAEANAITSKVKPCGESSLQFELSNISPVMSLGYGESAAVPQLCVRLVRSLGFENHKDVEVLLIWTFAHFAGRLEVMREVYKAWLAGSGQLIVDPRSNPWGESLNSKDIIKVPAWARARLSKVGPPSPNGTAQQSMSGMSSFLSELGSTTLRLEVENARLQARLQAMEAQMSCRPGSPDEVYADPPWATRSAGDTSVHTFTTNTKDLLSTLNGVSPVRRYQTYSLSHATSVASVNSPIQVPGSSCSSGSPNRVPMSTIPLSGRMQGLHRSSGAGATGSLSIPVENGVPMAPSSLRHSFGYPKRDFAVAGVTPREGSASVPCSGAPLPVWMSGSRGPLLVPSSFKARCQIASDNGRCLTPV
ncbi:unnamed protein product [Polarella glacialis]|uniref:Kinesin motor domain-containing protein n=1 Tax=Polarella glacialis TaxID=89957 RepID=A0A813GDP9_POLGL|nr:unnamed protein product [Polarella glacialis]